MMLFILAFQNEYSSTQRMSAVGFSVHRDYSLIRNSKNWQNMFSQPPKNRVKSVTRTIRIDDDINYQLEKLAHEQRVSVNYFANQALRKFVEWDIYAERLGFVTLRPDIFEKLIVYITDAKAHQLGCCVGMNHANGLIAYLLKRVDLET